MQGVRRVRRAFAGLLAFVAASGLANAQTPAGEWRISCASAAVPGRCQMVHPISRPDGGPPDFMLTISAAAGSKDHFAVLTAPLRVFLVPGIQLQVDTRRPFKAHFEMCDAVGCHAGFKLSDPVLDAFAKGNIAKIHVWTAKDKGIELPVSLNGFARTYARFANGERQ
ncbi:invasion associated locus B family protein [Neorhizobium sp. T786]|nr:invasion associated locus B family protein [Neorhizobium xiangyangii]